MTTQFTKEQATALSDRRINLPHGDRQTVDAVVMPFIVGYLNEPATPKDSAEGFRNFFLRTLEEAIETQERKGFVSQPRIK